MFFSICTVRVVCGNRVLWFDVLIIIFLIPTTHKHKVIKKLDGFLDKKYYETKMKKLNSN